MANFDLRIDIDTHGIEERIQSAIDDGVQDSAKELERKLEQKARGKIVQENAIWRRELLASFRGEIIQRPDGLWLRFSNVSDHAGPVEDGAQYEERGPPVDALLPWVRDNLGGFQIVSGSLRRSRSRWIGPGSMHPKFPGYTVGEVDKAFWLQQKIKRDGIAPVGYMAYAAAWARANGHGVVSDNISSSLRKRGLL